MPAVRVGAMLGPDALLARLNALGFDLKESAGWYGASLALGGADVTLLALTNAYRTLANGGLHAPAVSDTAAAVRPPVRVVDAAAAFLTTDILADNNARARTFGLASALATRGFAADDFRQVADVIARALQPDADVAELRGEVAALADRFPLYEGLETW